MAWPACVPALAEEGITPRPAGAAVWHVWSCCVGQALQSAVVGALQSIPCSLSHLPGRGRLVHIPAPKSYQLRYRGSRRSLSRDWQSLLTFLRLKDKQFSLLRCEMSSLWLALPQREDCTLSHFALPGQGIYLCTLPGLSECWWRISDLPPVLSCPRLQRQVTSCMFLLFRQPLFLGMWHCSVSRVSTQSLLWVNLKRQREI